jgi:hypothetical protein
MTPREFARLPLARHHRHASVRALGDIGCGCCSGSISHTAKMLRGDLIHASAAKVYRRGRKALYELMPDDF